MMTQPCYQDPEFSCGVSLFVERQEREKVDKNDPLLRSFASGLGTFFSHPGRGGRSRWRKSCLSQRSLWEKISCPVALRIAGAQNSLASRQGTTKSGSRSEPSNLPPPSSSSCETILQVQVGSRPSRCLEHEDPPSTILVSRNCSLRSIRRKKSRR